MPHSTDWYRYGEDQHILEAGDYFIVISRSVFGLWNVEVYNLKRGLWRNMKHIYKSVEEAKRDIEEACHGMGDS